MTEGIRFKMLVRRVKPMSSEGIRRLNKRTRLNYQKEVYKRLKTVEIDIERVYDELGLAKFLLLNFGAGTYDAIGWRNRGGGHTKQLFKVVIRGNIATKWGYEFIHSRGMARHRSFWVSE